MNPQILTLVYTDKYIFSYCGVCFCNLILRYLFVHKPFPCKNFI